MSAAASSSAAASWQSIAGQVLQRYSETKINDILSQGGNSFVSAANARTPVITGRLRAGNQFSVGNLSLRLFNDVEYAGYVNNGTSRMAPRNFFDAGVESAIQTVNQGMKTL